MTPRAIFLRRATFLAGILVILGMSAGCFLQKGWGNPGSQGAFQPRFLPIESFHLFDIGVTDMNGDGNLDLFTTNHSARQSFLLGNGRGGWRAWSLEASGLSQSATFPGLEDSDQTPKLTSPGLYIYWHDSRLVLQSYHLRSAPVQGLIAFYTPVVMETRGDFGEATPSAPQDQSETRRLVRFQASGTGQLILTPQPYPRVGSPVRIQLAHPDMAERTFIGLQRISPPASTFLLDLKDRHGMVWTPAGEEGIRVFIAGGANLGLTDILPPDRRAYELFEKAESRFQREDATRLGLDKKDCAARQASFRDVNGDGWGDFYVVCIRNTANQLFLGSAVGRFVEAASDLGLAMPDAGTFAWLDVDDDTRPDLIWAGEHGILLYRNQGNRFRREQIDAPKVWAQHLAVADFDGDGDGDAFVASKDANLLLVNDGGSLRYQAPESLGLPRASLAAQWVDMDNDGLLDLYALPGGLFRQTSDGRFRSVADMGLPPTPALEDLRSARAVWFDGNNDGYREVVIAYQTLDKRWQITYLKRRPGPNHWLEVILRGPQASAMGAQVIVRTPDGRQVSYVGWGENSHYGQGNDRVYFGLGSRTRVDELTIIWPDGLRQTLADVAADQVLKLTYPAP